MKPCNSNSDNEGKAGGDSTPVVHVKTTVPVYGYWPGDENSDPFFIGPEGEPSGAIRAHVRRDEKTA